MDKCIKPKCQYSKARKKCISPNPYIEKIAECGRKNILMKDCIKTYDKIKDRKKACERMIARLKYEKKQKKGVIKISSVKQTPTDLKKFKKIIKPNNKYIGLNKYIIIPQTNEDLDELINDWLDNNNGYVIQPLGGFNKTQKITSINDILIANFDNNEDNLDDLGIGLEGYINKMKKTGIFNETPNIYAICEMYGVIVNLFLWIKELNILKKMTFVPWKYDSNYKIKNALKKKHVLTLALINDLYFSVENDNIKDAYKLNNNTERLINKELKKKYNMHLYIKKTNDNNFNNSVRRQLQLLNTRIK